jgi:hypothetical protein
MRPRYVAAIVAAPVIGFGMTLFFFFGQVAKADVNAIPNASMNTLQLQSDVGMNNLSAQKIRDMTFVFNGD